jgi:hypothetical protein
VTGRVTGLQFAVAAFAAFLRVAQELFSPREYVVLLDLLSRRLQHELERQRRSRRRWAA